jgi:hypothetical protein
VLSENGVLIDLFEVRRVVDTCDVFTVGFRLFPQRLLVDTRFNAEEGPLVSVVEPVATVEERFFWLGQKRPRFGMPQRFAFFIWPHSIAMLEELGLGERIRGRCRSALWPQGDAQVDEAFSQLRALERQTVLDAIRGRNCHTLWPRR